MKNLVVGLIGLTSFVVGLFPAPVLAETTCAASSPNDHFIQFCGNTYQRSPERVIHKSSYTIPIKRRISGVPVIEVVLDGDHKVEMLFDTGASLISLNPNVAQNVNISATKETKKTYAATGAIESNTGYVPTMQAGDLMYRNVKVLITPNLSIPGILGQSFFGDYDITIKRDVIQLTYNPEAYQ